MSPKVDDLPAGAGESARRKAVAIARFDSFTKAALVLLRTLSGHGFLSRIITNEPPLESGPCEANPVAWCQVSDRTAMRDLVRHPEIAQADLLVLCLDGRETMDVLLAVHEGHRAWASRPVLVSAYSGIILCEPVKGLMARAPIDVLCLNSEADLALYQDSVLALGGDPSNGIVTGPPILWNMGARALVKDGAIVFFEQPNIPRTSKERTYVVDQLRSLAARFPWTEIVLKPRIAPGNRTFHDCSYPMSALLLERSGGRLLPNLSVVWEPVQTLLLRTSVALTFSSTAALEAIKLGVPTRILTDLGFSERLGTVFFAKSGCLAQFRDIHPQMTPSVNRHWLQAVSGPDDGAARFMAAVWRTLSTRAGASAWPVRPLSPFYGGQDWRDYAVAPYASAVGPAVGRASILGGTRVGYGFTRGRKWVSTWLGVRQRCGRT